MSVLTASIHRVLGGSARATVALSVAAIAMTETPQYAVIAPIEGMLWVRRGSLQKRDGLWHLAAIGKFHQPEKNALCDVSAGWIGPHGSRRWWDVTDYIAPSDRRCHKCVALNKVQVLP